MMTKGLVFFFSLSLFRFFFLFHFSLPVFRFISTPWFDFLIGLPFARCHHFFFVPSFRVLSRLMSIFGYYTEKDKFQLSKHDAFLSLFSFIFPFLPFLYFFYFSSLYFSRLDRLLKQRVNAISKWLNGAGMDEGGGG